MDPTKLDPIQARSVPASCGPERGVGFCFFAPGLVNIASQLLHVSVSRFAYVLIFASQLFAKRQEGSSLGFGGASSVHKPMSGGRVLMVAKSISQHLGKPIVETMVYGYLLGNHRSRVA